MATAHRNLGNVLMIQGRQDEALESYRRALGINADYPDVYNNVGNILTDKGRFEEACENYLKALQRAPTFVEAYINLGLACIAMGNKDDAVQCFRKALDVNPQNTDALINLGNLLREQGDAVGALQHCHRAYELLPAGDKVLGGLAAVLKDVSLTKYQPWLDDVIKAVLTCDDVEHQQVADTVVAHLSMKHGIPRQGEPDEQQVRDFIGCIRSDELFPLFLSRVVNQDGAMESLLTGARRALLMGHAAGGRLDAETLEAAGALALQGIRNEYVFALDDEEKRAVNGLKAAIEDRVSAAAPVVDDRLQADLLVYAMYEGLSSLSGGTRLAQVPVEAWSPAMRPVVEETLLFIMEEQALKGRIRSVGVTDNATSEAVRAQYEENPYPRWTRLARVGKTGIGRMLRQAFPHFSAPELPGGGVRILVAGCGTGRQAITMALRHPDSQVLAVDLSKSSLAYSMRMAARYGVGNIEFAQGDILALSGLDGDFHVIECSGVLHHMKDPAEGWSALAGLLCDRGLMKVALYSEKARKDVVDAATIIAEKGLTAHRDDIRRLRSHVLKGQRDSALSGVMRFRDFFSLSECRDLLFHVVEHRFTCRQLKDMIAAQGMEFLGFEFADGSHARRYRSQFPEDETLTDLDLWDQFEDLYPDTFRGMYQFWCQKGA